MLLVVGTPVVQRDTQKSRTCFNLLSKFFKQIFDFCNFGFLNKKAEKKRGTEKIKKTTELETGLVR